MERTLTERIAKHIRRGHRWNSDVSDPMLVNWAEQYAMVRSFGVTPRMQPVTWTGASDGRLYSFEADFRALARMPDDEFEEYVESHHTDGRINKVVREYTASVDKIGRENAP